MGPAEDVALLQSAGFEAFWPAIGHPVPCWPFLAVDLAHDGFLESTATSPRVTSAGSKGLLGKFWRLAEADDEVIAGMARRFGPLTDGVGAPPASRFLVPGREPVVWWRTLSFDTLRLARASAHLRMKHRHLSHQPPEAAEAAKAARLAIGELSLLRGCKVTVRRDYDGELRSSELLSLEWTADGPPLGDPDHGVSLGSAEYVVIEYLNAMLRLSPPVVRYLWNPSQGPRVQLATSGLLGALAVQLGQLVAGDRPPLLCAACGTLFMPTGERARGGRRYCEECSPPVEDGQRKRGAAQRAAENKYRAKVRQNRKADQGGR